MRIGIVTLGCDKNTVDNEYLAGLLEKAGCELVPADTPDTLPPVDAVVVTTCGFIGDAKKQSLETILDLAGKKRLYGSPRRLFVAGCLSQRYAEELLKEIPEIDGLVGVGQFQEMARMVLNMAGTTQERNAALPIPLVDIDTLQYRHRLDRKPHAFLKIADGCNHACSFCAIPIMKGRLRSVAPDILLAEARALVDQGVRELNLIAQDLTVYGTDRWNDYRLPQLLRDLCTLDGDFWVRCLYCYPGGVTDELIAVMAAEHKIVPYIDIPLQHLDPDILRRMKRPAHGLKTVQLVQRLRQRIPDIAIRTTVMVGFPGETRKAFLSMLDGIRALSFNWLGVFQYSPEEGTPAVHAPRQVGKPAKERRWHAIMETQAEVCEELNQERVGKRIQVLVEGHDGVRNQWVGRSPGEAPEVDGKVFFAASRPIECGEFVSVTITDADVYDVFGRAEDVA
jgi:ribosomal protein S12 methylthiotransferase